MGKAVINTDLNLNEGNLDMEGLEVESSDLALSPDFTERGKDICSSKDPSLLTKFSRDDWDYRWDALKGCSVYLDRGTSLHGNHWLREGSGIPSTESLGMPLVNDTLLDMGRSDIHRVLQHKRAKILSPYGACHSLATTSHGTDSSDGYTNGNHSTLDRSAVPTQSMTVLYYGSDDDSDIPRNFDIEGDDGDKDSNPETDDFDVRMDLAEDLLHMVFSFLSHRDLCKAGATCKQWHAASIHEDFWRCLNFEDISITSENFAAICQRYPGATQVNILGVPENEVLVMEAMTYLRKLEHLTLGKGHGQLGDGFFDGLTNCSSLKSLSITDASLGTGIQEITLQHDVLHDLQITKCRVLRISLRCPQLHTLSLKRTTMAHVLLNCPQLQKLDISACHKLSDAGIRSATASCPLLTYLDMSSCSCVSDDTLREIAFVCPNLQVLDASFCPNISLESVRLPMLLSLKLQSCEGISSASVAAISHSYMLEALLLDCCGLLTSISLDLPCLQAISLVHCRKFVDLNLRCPMLSSVKISNCPALHRINITSHSLKKLVLQKQESLATLSLQCHGLQEVDLSDCESLTNSVCDIFSDGGGCPMLRSLILDNCESLTEVGLISSALVDLSLVGCRAMTLLKLSCPNLQKVNLDGCDHLETASFCPVGLRSLNLGICPKLSYLQIEAANMLVLELQGCGVLSKASINCPSLLSLDASFCSQLKDDSLSGIAASCPQIKSLVLSSCLSIGSDGLSSLHWLHSLTLLDLSYTFLLDLQPVFEACSQLETLRLMACKYLTNSSLDALYKDGALPALRGLDLSYSTVGQSAIEGLLTGCTNLTNVNLNGCANMHDLVWGGGNDLLRWFPGDFSLSNLSPLETSNILSNQPGRLLETLNCVGCPNIRKVVIPPLARCFYLSKLNLHLSANLKKVDISCLNLISLNLSHCSSLEFLKLDCPRLGILILLACGMISEAAVEVAISGCNTLETLNLQHCPKINLVNLGKLRMACPSLKRIHSSLWE